MTVKRLFVPYVSCSCILLHWSNDVILDDRHADDTTGLTWGGQTYETSDARVSGTLQVTNVDVASGVDIQETEVVMLCF
jgi:hypothetical protein